MEREKGVVIDEGEQEELLGIKLKRVLSVGKRGGPFTPSPSWKLEDPRPDQVSVAAAPPPAVSARKLGAGLWEVQDVLPLSRMSRRVPGARRMKDVNPLDRLHAAPDSPHDRPQSAGSLRRHVAASVMQQHKLNERNNRVLQLGSSSRYSSSMEVSAFNQASSPISSSDIKGRAGVSGYSLKTSTELLKVLNRIWSLEEHHTAHVSLVKSLKMDLEHARERIRDLTREQQAYCHEVNDLMSQIADDKLIRKSKEHDRIKAAVKSIKEELEDEKRLRRRSESLHRRLGKEFSELKASFTKALKDLENERKANHLLEDLCDEFAKGVTNYEQEARELKQKSYVECHRKTDPLVLHISEAWLDERLQLKIAEAQGNMAEKSTIIDRLSGEIKTFLQARHSACFKGDNLYHKDVSLRRQSLESVHLNGAISAPRDAEDDDSIASNLHCFELNMTSHKNVNHDLIKPHCEDGIELIRKSNFTRKKMGYSENLKCQSSSFEEKGDGNMECYGSKMQFADTIREIQLNNDTETGSVEENLIETVPQKIEIQHAEGHEDRELKWTMHRSNDLIESSLQNRLEFVEGCTPPHDDYHRDESHGKSSRSHFVPVGKNSVSLKFQTPSSPVQQWCTQHISAAHELPECSTKLLKGVKENTLKAKLVEARLEGQHARLKASKSSSGGI